MKRSFLLLRATLLGVALSTVLHAAVPFEGSIQMKLSDGTTAIQAIKFTIKGDFARFDLPADPAMAGMPPGAVILDYKKNEMDILMEMQGQKMLMRQTLPAAAPADATADKTAKTPEATGRTDTIADYSAKEYKAPGDKPGETVELWLASGLGHFTFPAMRGQPGGKPGSGPAWEKFARDAGFFPLKAITRDAAGNVKSSLEVTKIDRTPVSDSLFSTAGYTAFQMPGTP